MTKILKNNILLLGVVLLVITMPLTACSDISTTEPLSTTAEVTTSRPSQGTSEATTETTAETTLSPDEAHEERLRDNVKAWGLGNRLIDYVGNNREYDWYIDQAHTGEHSGANCGPSSVTMAALWVNPDFNKTAEDARDAYRSTGGWWYGEDIESCLDDFNITHSLVEIKDAYTLRNIIDSGKIAIINNTMGAIPYADSDDFRVNRFYSFDSGHYFVIKGYALVDNITYFEVYDPNNWDMTYSGGEPMGKDRYYDAESLMHSIELWYPYAVVITP